MYDIGTPFIAAWGGKPEFDRTQRRVLEANIYSFIFIDIVGIRS
jgi:hypothetical protein